MRSLLRLAACCIVAESNTTPGTSCAVRGLILVRRLLCRYSFGRELEDVHYAMMVQQTPGRYLNTVTVQYRWQVGSRLDLQLDKLRRSMGNSRQVAQELERYHDSPQERCVVLPHTSPRVLCRAKLPLASLYSRCLRFRWTLKNAMDFTDAHRTRMERKAAAHVTGRAGPPPLTDAMLPPLMAAAPWLAGDGLGTASALHTL